jgi:hypothetical protein
MAVVTAATVSAKAEARPAFAFDPDGQPALSLRGPRSAGPVAERFGLAVPDNDAMLGVRRSAAFGADRLGLPGLPQPAGHRDAFAAPTGERSSLRTAIGAGRFSIPLRQTKPATRPLKTLRPSVGRSVRARQQGPARSIFAAGVAGEQASALP